MHVWRALPLPRSSRGGALGVSVFVIDRNEIRFTFVLASITARVAPAALSETVGGFDGVEGDCAVRGGRTDPSRRRADG